MLSLLSKCIPDPLEQISDKLGLLVLGHSLEDIALHLLLEILVQLRLQESLQHDPLLLVNVDHILVHGHLV